MKQYAAILSLFFIFCAITGQAEEICSPDQYPHDVKKCVDVEILGWSSAPPDELAPTTETGLIVTVTGGRPPYAWKISGQGFYLVGEKNANLTEITTNNTTATIKTEDACGAGTLEVADACGGRADGTMRSTDGIWTDQGSTLECPWTAPHSEWDNPRLYEYYSVKGDTKIYNHIVKRSGSGNCIRPGVPSTNCDWDPLDKETCQYYGDERSCISDLAERQVTGNHPDFSGTINTIGGCIYYNGSATCSNTPGSTVCGTYWFTGEITLSTYECGE